MFSPSRNKHAAERRVHARRPAHLPAYIAPGEQNPAHVSNISEDGLALHTDVPLAENRILGMRFLLPESKNWVETGGRIAWLSESRKEAGVRFLDLPQSARSKIQEWILLESSGQHFGKESVVIEKDGQLAEHPGHFFIREIQLDHGLSEVTKKKWMECNRLFPSHTIDCNPDWIEEHFKQEKNRIRIFLIERGGAVLGAVPCVLDQTLTCNLGEFKVAKFPMRILRFLGYTPNMPTEEAAYDLLFKRILNSDVDAVHIPELKTESFAWNYVRHSPLIRKLFSHQIPRQYPHLSIHLDGTFDSYMQRFPAKLRQNWRRAIRLLGQRGEVRLVRVTETSEIENFLEAAYAISRQTWQSRRVNESLARRDPDLMRRELRFLAERGWLRCYLLKSGGEPCSFVLGQEYGRYFYVEAAGVDRAWRRHSAGTIILLLVLEDLFKGNSPQRYDFGSHVKWQELFASESYPAADVWLFRRRAYSLLTSGVYRACDVVSTKTGAALDRLRLRSRVKKLLWSRE